MKELSRINITVPHKMREKIDKYVEENGTTITSLFHVALTHYFNHLESKEQIESLLTGMLKAHLEKSKETTTIED